MVAEKMKLLVQKQRTTIHSNHHSQNTSILSSGAITQWLLSMQHAPLEESNPNDWGPKLFIIHVKHACPLLWKKTLFLLDGTIRNFPFPSERCFLYIYSFKKSLEQVFGTSVCKMYRNIRDWRKLSHSTKSCRNYGWLQFKQLFQVTKAAKWLSDLGFKPMSFHSAFRILLFSVSCSRVRHYLGINECLYIQ